MAVNSSLILKQFTPNYILFSVNGHKQVYPWKNLIYPSLITKVYCEINTSLPVPNWNDFPLRYPIGEFSVIYDKIAKDDFAMYNTVSGQFTIPISGYWKITYTTTLFFGVGLPPEGRFTLNGYVKKNVNDRFVLSCRELSLLRHEQRYGEEVRTIENSGIVLFNKGDVFNINGVMLGDYDVAHSNLETCIYIVGSPTILNEIVTLDIFSTSLLDGFNTCTECTVEFVRPSSFIV